MNIFKLIAMASFCLLTSFTINASSDLEGKNKVGPISSNSQDQNFYCIHRPVYGDKGEGKIEVYALVENFDEVCPIFSEGGDELKVLIDEDSAIWEGEEALHGYPYPQKVHPREKDPNLHECRFFWCCFCRH
jgi:hypothetical protein